MNATSSHVRRNTCAAHTQHSNSGAHNDGQPWTLQVTSATASSVRGLRTRVDDVTRYEDIIHKIVTIPSFIRRRLPRCYASGPLPIRNYFKASFRNKSLNERLKLTTWASMGG